MRTGLSSARKKVEDLNLNEFLNQGGAAFLKAKDVPGKSAKAVIVGVREADLQQTGKTLILDIEIKEVKWSFPLNVTNLKVMMEQYGTKTSKWIGKVITFVKVLVNNPKLGKEVEGLRIK